MGKQLDCVPFVGSAPPLRGGKGAACRQAHQSDAPELESGPCVRLVEEIDVGLEDVG